MHIYILHAFVSMQQLSHTVVNTSAYEPHAIPLHVCSREHIVVNATLPSCPQVFHDVAFKRAAIDNQHDEDQWEFYSTDDESFMGVNDNTDKANAETDKVTGIGKMMIVIVIMTMKCMTIIPDKVTAVMWNHFMRKLIGIMFYNIMKII